MTILMVSPGQEAREAAVSCQQQELLALYPEMLPTRYGSMSQHPSTPWDYGLVVLVGNFSPAQVSLPKVK